MLVDMEMGMRATENIEIGQDITPPLLPLSFSLYDSCLSSHCSSCFRPLSTMTTAVINTSFLRYCSDVRCSSSSFVYLHFSSGEHHLFRLLRSNPSLFPHPDSSDLRAALRLLHLHHHRLSLSHRLLGLLTNRRKLLDDEESSARVRAGGRVMATARAMRDGGDRSLKVVMIVSWRRLCCAWLSPMVLRLMLLERGRLGLGFMIGDSP